MCIIINRADPVSQQNRNNIKKRKETFKAERIQAGFTLVEVLVSLCIVIMIIHAVCQWGMIMQRTSESMAQSQHAVFLAQQIVCGVQPDCPENWEIHVLSQKNGGILYQSEITVNTRHKQWQFYYVGTEKLVYETEKSATG